MHVGSAGDSLVCLGAVCNRLPGDVHRTGFDQQLGARRSGHRQCGTQLVGSGAPNLERCGRGAFAFTNRVAALHGDRPFAGRHIRDQGVSVGAVDGGRNHFAGGVGQRERGAEDRRAAVGGEAPARLHIVRVHGNLYIGGLGRNGRHVGVGVNGDLNQLQRSFEASTLTY